jgi:hypothetical protein
VVVTFARMMMGVRSQSPLPSCLMEASASKSSVREVIVPSGTVKPPFSLISSLGTLSGSLAEDPASTT